MRSGRGAVGQKMGGAWDCVTISGAAEPKPRDSSAAGRTANTAGEIEALFTGDGCTKGACIAGMVLQQSRP